MTTHILDGHDRTVIGRRAITVTVGGVRESELRLEILGLGADDARPLVQRPGKIVLPAVNGRIVVQARPAAGHQFPEGAVLNLQLSTEPTPHAEADRVVIRTLEVSGLELRDLVAIEKVDEGRVAVSALNAVVDVPLGDLGKAARGAARARLRGDRSREQVDLRVAVDMSVSMTPVLADGLLAAALEVMSGLSQVLGPGGDVNVTLLTDHAVPLPPAPPVEIVGRTRARIDELGLGYGFRSSPPDLDARPGSRTYVLTDSVPADADLLRDTGTCHLVVLGGWWDPSAPPVRPGRTPDGLPVTFLESPGAGGDAVRDLLGAPARLSALVASLLVEDVTDVTETAGAHR